MKTIRILVLITTIFFLFGGCGGGGNNNNPPNPNLQRRGPNQPYQQQPYNPYQQQQPQGNGYYQQPQGNGYYQQPYSWNPSGNTFSPDTNGWLYMDVPYGCGGGMQLSWCYSYSSGCCVNSYNGFYSVEKR